MGLDSRLKVLTKSSTRNKITNPSFEYNITGWSGVNGGSGSQSTAYSAFGVGSLRLDTAGDADGIRSPVMTLTPSTIYTFSAWVYTAASRQYKIHIRDNVAGNYLETTIFTATSQWQRVSVTDTLSSNSTFTLDVTQHGSGSGSLWIDGVQVEQGQLSSYCDGDQSGCEWVGSRHASESVRSGDSKAGGLSQALNPDTSVLRITSLANFGAPPFDIVMEEYITRSGGYYQRTRTQPRTMAISMTAVTPNESAFHTAVNTLMERLAPTDYR